MSARPICVALLTMALSLLTTDAAVAQKAGGTPPGTIHYWYYPPSGSGSSIWEMDGGGGNKRRIDNLAVRSGDHLSYLTHGGTRWWLTSCSSLIYPFQSVLCALSDAAYPDGTPVALVPLQEIGELPGTATLQGLRWAQDDSQIALGYPYRVAFHRVQRVDHVVEGFRHSPDLIRIINASDLT